MSKDPNSLPAQDPKTALAGLTKSPREVNDKLRHAGLDPERLSVYLLGIPRELLKYAYPLWARRMLVGYTLCGFALVLEFMELPIPGEFTSTLSLLAGLVVIQTACQSLVDAAESLAARLRWDHYIAGTVSEILSTLPEVVVIGFVIVVSPSAALLLAIITIYNNTLVFSLYSYLLPKDRYGKFLMPKPITEAGAQILIAGGALGLTVGLVMLIFSSGNHPKTGFAPVDLIFVSVIMLTIFAVYVYKLIADYSSEEQTIRNTLNLSVGEIAERRTAIYRNVGTRSYLHVGTTFLIGVLGSFVGGERIAYFAQRSLADFGFNPVVTAILLALSAGMSEYFILWTSHRRGDYGIALANAFGGITQVTFLILPCTLLGIAGYQLFGHPMHPELPIPFSVQNILMFIFLFPTFYTLSALIEEDHTLGILDTTIMTCIIVLLIFLLATYGAAHVPLAEHG